MSIEFVWLDGRIVRADRAFVPALDRAVQYGYGLFEVTRAYGGVPFRIDRHLARMRRSARRFDLKLPLGDDAIERAARQLLVRSRRPDASLRLVLTGGEEAAASRFMIRARPLRPLPPSWLTRGARVRIAEWRRDPRVPLHGHKTLNYLEHVRGHEAAWKGGFADTILIGLSGELLEGCASNLFLVQDGALHTPSLGPILPGVTRAAVIEIARSLGLRTVERRLDLKELDRAEEAFITNALIELVPVTRVESRKIGAGRPGALTRLLMERYRRLVVEETKGGN
ncbi:MAG: aminotransferase class IV [Planctomycetes bacterium]|nr:aminotransferase class IV [Planctomycetota bacterium]